MMAKPLRYIIGKVAVCLMAALVIPVYPALLHGPGLVAQRTWASSGSVRFEDVTVKVGLNTQGANWGDIAVGDFTNDGWDGVYIGHHGVYGQGGAEGAATWPRGGQLFRNNHNGTFTEVTNLLPPVVDMTQHRHIAIWCDVEGTGYEDLIIGTGFRDDVSDVSGVNDLWLHNDGKSLTDIASKLGTTDKLSKVGAMTCGNLAGHGAPDVMLANLDPSPALGKQPVLHLWVNYGTSFAEEGAKRGLTDTSEYHADVSPYSINCADFRRVGFMDCLALGTDYNAWLLNDRGTSLRPVSGYERILPWVTPYNTDSYFADFTGHGLLDVAVGNNNGPDALMLWCNNGTTIPSVNPCGGFPRTPPTPNAGTGAMAVGDFDNSGAPSIFMMVTGGCVKDGNGCKAADLLLMNNGHGTFTNMADQAGLNQFAGTKFLVAGGAAVIDYDMDGRLDLIVGYNGKGAPGPFRVYRNVTENGNGWIGFRLRGPETIGSWVTITACGQRQVQQLTARTGWLHQSSRVVHFGLGMCSGPVAVETIWRTGQVTHFTLAANKYYTMTPTGQPVPLAGGGSTPSGAPTPSTPSGAPTPSAPSGVPTPSTPSRGPAPSTPSGAPTVQPSYPPSTESEEHDRAIHRNLKPET